LSEDCQCRLLSGLPGGRLRTTGQNREGQPSRDRKGAGYLGLPPLPYGRGSVLSASSKWIDTFVLEGEGEGVRDIYSLTQDEFKLCYDPSSPTRPTEFNTKVDFVRALFTLKRVTPKQSLEKSGKVK